jgi:tetratricopeptide (TPR) repeat protein
MLTSLRHLEEGQKVALRAYALSGKGAAYSGLGKLDAAQKDFNESLALCPKNAWVYYNMALACERQGVRAISLDGRDRSLGQTSLLESLRSVHLVRQRGLQNAF